MIIAIRLMRHQTDCILCHPEMCAIPGEDGVHPCPVSSRSLPETEPIPKRVPAAGRRILQQNNLSLNFY